MSSLLVDRKARLNPALCRVQGAHYQPNHVTGKPTPFRAGSFNLLPLFFLLIREDIFEDAHEQAQDPKGKQGPSHSNDEHGDSESPIIHKATSYRIAVFASWTAAPLTLKDIRHRHYSGAASKRARSFERSRAARTGDFSIER
jgi:hypothetical protein